MISYSKTNGRAHDIRLVSDDYVPKPNEFVIAGEVLPSVASLSDISEVDDFKAQALAEARQARTMFFARFDGLQASANTTGNTALALEIEAVKAAMRSITTDVDLTGLTTLPQMRVAVLNRWKAIRAPLSTQLKAAFAALDS